jgi:hypothetical protein
MSHRAGDGRKKREVGAALALRLELGAFEAFAYLIVADLGRGQGGRCWILQRFDLLRAVVAQRLGRSRVMAVTVNNHRICPAFVEYVVSIVPLVI